MRTRRFRPPGRGLDPAASRRAVLLLGSAALFAGVPPAASGQDVTARLQGALDRGRAELAIRGASAAVILADGAIWTGGSGAALGDGERAVGVTPETTFEIGSITKTYTGALAAQLAGEGLLSLDDPLALWMPDAPDADRITLRQLLQHTSGWADTWDEPGFIPGLVMSAARVWSPEEVIARMPDPVLAPGEGWEYSSTGYVAVGRALELATDRSFAGLLRERFFIPLGLEHTLLGGADPIPEPTAHGYVDINGDGEAEDLTAALPRTSFLTAASSAGGILATPRDVAMWLRSLLRGEAVSPAALEQMTRWVERPDGHHYGLGLLRIELEGRTLIGHRGNSAGFSAAAWHLPDEGLTVVVLTNANGVLVTPIVEALLDAAAQPDQISRIAVANR